MFLSNKGKFQVWLSYKLITYTYVDSFYSKVIEDTAKTSTKAVTSTITMTKITRTAATKKKTKTIADDVTDWYYGRAEYCKINFEK